MYLKAICEGRGEAREEVGLAAIDISHPDLGIYQVSDTQGYTQTLAAINLLNPIEVCNFLLIVLYTHFYK